MAAGATADSIRREWEVLVDGSFDDGHTLTKKGRPGRFVCAVINVWTSEMRNQTRLWAWSASDPPEVADMCDATGK